jgi:hypothetical protein
MKPKGVGLHLGNPHTILDTIKGGVMKKTVVLTLVLLVVCSFYLFSETLDCQHSFELGENNAKEMHSSWPWYVLGIGSVILAGRAYDELSYLGFRMWLEGNTHYDDPWVRALPFIGLAVVLSVPFIPALFLSTKRENIFPPFGGVDLECYRDGYVKKARLKNSGALLLGELTMFAGAAVLVFIFFF